MNIYLFRITHLFFLCFTGLSVVKGQSSLKSFQLQHVRLLPGPFKDAQGTDLNYMLSLDPDRLLAPYLKEAGLVPKKENYGSWENTGLDGHIGGHYLSALSYMYASTGDERLNQRLDYMLAQLQRCQDKIGSGYLGGMPGGIAMWNDIAKGKIVSDTFALNGKWVPLYNLHKTMAGLRDAYVIAKKIRARTMLIRLTDFIYKISEKLTDDQIQLMLTSEHGSINEIFADVSVYANNEKYLRLARRFSHHFLLDPLIAGMDKLDGLHANMQIPKVVGFKRISELDGDADYLKAAQFFWETVVQHRTVVIGGNSVSEHFNPSGDFTSMITDIAGPETCNTYNMLKLTKALFQTSAKLSYVDFYERALYNHILSSQHPLTGGFVYYTPMRPGHYRVYSQAQECMWCCVGSGMENHGKYGELIYNYDTNDLFVNLFIPSRLKWEKKGVVLSQHTKFPDEETTEVVIDSAKENLFTINIRYPGWVDSGKLAIAINEKNIKIESKPGTYIAIRRKWKRGDRIRIFLPMKITTESLPGGSGFIAFLHGPIVLAAKTDTTDLYKLFADSEQFTGYRARGKLYSLDSMPVLVYHNTGVGGYLKPVKGKPQTFIAPALIEPDKFKNLELIPFYKLHDARYIIYWPVRSGELRN
jgi:DUF1680 family protein